MQKKGAILLIGLLLLLLVGTVSANIWVPINNHWVDSSSNITYTIEMWNTTGATTWTPPGGVTNVTYLVIAGGGGGGDSRAGGGGAGGLLTATGFGVSGSILLSVGAGGNGATANNYPGTNGTYSSFSTINATGGGGGGSRYSTLGLVGGSGGGGIGAGAAGILGQGSRGGAGVSDAGGGGGGAGGNATNATSMHGGNGGLGLISLITDNSVSYAGGGGGGVYFAGVYGIGVSGGGNGSVGDNPGYSGINGFGGGGGGGGFYTSHQIGGNGGSGIVIIKYLTPVLLDTTPPASVTSLAASNTTCTELNLTYTKPADADFNHTMIYLDDILHVNESNTTNFHLFTGLTGGTSYTFSTKTVDITGNVNTTWVNITESATSCADTTPPASITNLVNNTTTCEQITWLWDNPLDADYNHLYVLKDNVWLGANLSNITTASTWTSLTGGVEYTFAARTVDLIGNENTTWVNGTANSTSCVKVCENQTGNISIYFSGSTQTSINWSWDQNETLTQASLDGVFLDFNSTTPFLQWDDFLPQTWHALKIYNETVGEYGRLNCTTNSTPPPAWTMEINPSTERSFRTEDFTGYWWILLIAPVVWILTRRT